MAAIAATSLLVIASTAMILMVLRNRVELRREMERLQVSQSKEMSGRQFMEALASASQGTGGTVDFDTKFLISALSSGSRRGEGEETVSISTFDPNNPTTKRQASDILTTSLTTKPMTTMRYPSLRFGFVQEDTPFIGREFRYRLDYSVVSKDNLSGSAKTPVGSTSGDLVNSKGTLVVDIIEVPAQLGVEGENIALVPDSDMKIEGGVAGRTVEAQSSMFDSLNIAASSSVIGSKTHSERIASLSASERAVAGSGSRFEASASGATMFVPVGSRGMTVYEKPTTSDNFTRYWHPYYQSELRIKVTISGGSYMVGVEKAARGAASGSPMTPAGGQIQRIYDDSDVRWITVVERWNSLTGTFGNEIEIQMPLLFQATDADSIYIESPGIPVVLREGVSLDRPFSIVTNVPLYIPTSFGTNGKPFSIFTPRLFFGRPGHAVSEAQLYGQRGLTGTTDIGGLPSDMKDGLVLDVPSKEMEYEPVQKAANLPPVYLKNWLIHVWDLEEAR